MVDFEITKTKLLFEQSNDKAHNYYFLVYGRIYNENKTKYRKFKYVEWFDIFDVMEYFEKDYVTKSDVKEYLNNLEFSPLYNIKNYNDVDGLKSFYAQCNETIEKYNSIACYWNV